MAVAGSFARRTAAFRFSFRPSISRSSPSPSRPQLPQLPLPARSSTSRSRSSFHRELPALFTMLPAHSAIASSRLVSKIPSEPFACVESKVVSLGRRISDLPMSLIDTTSISLMKNVEIENVSEVFFFKTTNSKNGETSAEKDFYEGKKHSI